MPSRLKKRDEDAPPLKKTGQAVGEGEQRQAVAVGDGRKPVGPEASAAGKVPRGWGRLAPSVFYLIVECARPMTWFPAFALIQPGLLAAVWGIVWSLGSKRLEVPWALRYMLAFCGLMLWHVFAASNNYLAFTTFKSFATMVVGYLLPMALLVRSTRDVRALMWCYVLFHVPTAIWGIMNQGRGLGAWMADENDLALALSAALGVAAYLIADAERKWPKSILIVAIGVFVVAVVATMSRGGFIGFIAVAAYIGLRGAKKLQFMFLAAALIVGFLLLAPDEYVREIRTIDEAHTGRDTGAIRLYYWEIAWEMFLDHPVAGVGSKNYGMRCVPYEDPEWKARGVHVGGRVAHSGYFTLIAEHGLIGVILAGLLAINWFRTRKRLRAYAARAPRCRDAQRMLCLSTGLAAAAVAVLVSSIFLSTLYYPPIWVLLTLHSRLGELPPLELKGCGWRVSSGGNRDRPRGLRPESHGL